MAFRLAVCVIVFFRTSGSAVKRACCNRNAGRPERKAGLLSLVVV